MAHRHEPPSAPQAPEAARQFWRNPEAQLAQAVRVNGGDGSRAARTPVVRDARLLPVPVRAQLRSSRQLRAAVAGRPVHALPTRQARALKRRAKRSWHRVAVAGLAGFAALLLALVLTPVPAAVGMAAAVFVLVLTGQR